MIRACRLYHLKRAQVRRDEFYTGAVRLKKHLYLQLLAALGANQIMFMYQMGILEWQAHGREIQ